MIRVSREFFDKLSPEEREWLLFECIQDQSETNKEFRKRLEKKVTIDRTLAGVAGFFGGIVGAFLGLDKFKF